MSTVPSPYTLQLKRFEGTDEDAHGNTVETYADPIDWKVRGYAPGANELMSQQNRDLSMVLWTITADVDSVDPLPVERDLVTLAGTDYMVTACDDWTHGPWANPAAGISVMVQASEG